ncbi:MAG: hypothetical protein HY286_04410 [Planctomycetes bacterium]|nr:hypothetical protein [Planctomycetota bacterium]
MENSIFPRPTVTSELQKYILVELWLDRTRSPELKKESEENQQYQMDKYKTVARPYYVVLQSDGETVVDQFGFGNAATEGEMLDFLHRAAAK